MKEYKPKKCKQCGRDFKPFSSLDKVCSSVCFYAYKEAQEIEKRFKVIEAKVKERDSVKLLTKVAKQLAQKWARIRDRDLPCISCGTNQSIEWHGCHLYKSELYSGVRFDELNLARGCKKCNVFLSGNEVGYVKGFIERHGLIAFNELSDRATKTKNKKWTVPELKEIINYYKQKIKDNE